MKKTLLSAILAGMSYFNGYAVEHIIAPVTSSISQTAIQTAPYYNELELQYKVDVIVPLKVWNPREKNAGTMTVTNQYADGKAVSKSSMILRGEPQIDLEARIDLTDFNTEYAKYHRHCYKTPVEYTNADAGRKMDFLGLLHYVRSDMIKEGESQDVQFIYQKEVYAAKLTHVSDNETIKTPIGNFSDYDKYRLRISGDCKMRGITIYLSKNGKKLPFLIEQKGTSGVIGVETKSYLKGVIYR